MAAVSWEQAWQDALYGPDGFYLRREGPIGHFRTSSHNPLFAVAMARLAGDLDLALDEPDDFTVVDVGAGRGELLAALSDLSPSRWRLVGVDVAPRPSTLPISVDWQREPPASVTGLVMAHELLDVVPCPQVMRTSEGELRVIDVDPGSGVESAGATVGVEDGEWIERWWDLEVGERAEVGRPRDVLWSRLVAGVRAGAALAVDYSHTVDERSSGRYPNGTLIGHERGRVVAPVPDGRCDLTAHVALDACAAAASHLAEATFLTTQRAALLALGIKADGPAKDTGGSGADLGSPAEYAAGLQRAAWVSELLDPTGLGGFGWLMQTRALTPPAATPT